MSPQRAQARFQTAFDHAPVAMAIVTGAGHRVVRVNRAASALLGLPVEELVGRALEDFRDPADGSAHAWDEQDLTFSGERLCRAANGRPLWLEVHSAALPDTEPDGTPLCLLHLIDITPRRTAEAARARQEAWVRALGDVRLAVLLDSPTHRALSLICGYARRMLDATDAVVIMPSEDEAAGVVSAADGRSSEDLIDQTLRLEGSIVESVLMSGRAVLSGGAQQPDPVLDGLLPARGGGSALAIPLRTPDVVLGVLCLVRAAGEPFARADIDIARSFAEQAAATLHIGELRADRERLRVLEDRERIARDLHDSVIQDLFAAGMALDAIQPLITSPRAAERVATCIDMLDTTIKKIRRTIFELETTDPGGPRSNVLRAAVEGRRDQLGFEPKLELEGDVDDVAPERLDHLVAVISEALSNVARHAGAQSATVGLAVARSGGVRLWVRDDGSGFDPARVPPGNGLSNMRRRAELLGGTFTVTSAVGQGTLLELATAALSTPTMLPGPGHRSAGVLDLSVIESSSAGRNSPEVPEPRQA